MSASNPHTFFTITQPFLGAPLQFYPALGSREFEHLIDCYVTGSASKQDKLSQVTIDFYNNATVDLNTGALTKRYEVFNVPSWAGQSFEQSPVESQSSGFSPPVYTPSPGSSAALGDSTYGSISLTPPARNGAGRIAKKPKKDTKKTTEARLPGFSIMTKDGVDVTSSAGRGTKTKEQREHAHLMRQLKACADCKRKKVRCDPSHRRSHNEMSRTSTSTSKTSSSGRANPSPPASRQATQTGIPSFSTSNAFDDFVLFPEDTTSWNYADMALTDFEPQDLNHFNFDINDIDLNAFAPMNADQYFDLASSLNQQSSTSMIANQDYAPFMSDQYGLDQWAEPQGYSMSVNQTRPHPSGQCSDSGQVNSTTDLFADIDWSSSDIHQSQSQSSVANGNLIQSSPSDWSILESSVNANKSPQQGGIGTPSSQSSNEGSQASRSRPELDSSTASGTNPGFQDLSQGLSSEAFGILVDPSDFSSSGSSPSDSSQSDSSQSLMASSQSSPDTEKNFESRSPSPIQQLNASRFGYSVQEFTTVIERCQPIWYSLNNCAYEAYAYLENYLSQIQVCLVQLESTGRDLSRSMIAQLETLEAKLELLAATVDHQYQLAQIGRERHNNPEPDYGPKHLRECQVHARRLVRSLCATITSLQAQESTPSPSVVNSQILTSGRNVQLFIPSSTSGDERHSDALLSNVRILKEHINSSMSSTNSLSTSGINASTEVLVRERSRADNIPRRFVQSSDGNSSSSSSLANSNSGQVLVLDPPHMQLAAQGDRTCDQQVVRRLEQHANYVRLNTKPAATVADAGVIAESRDTQSVRLYSFSKLPAEAQSLAHVSTISAAEDQLAQYVASRQERLNSTVLASSRGAIPRIIVANDPPSLSSTSVLVHQSILVPDNGLSWQYMVVAALPIIAALLATSIVWHHHPTCGFRPTSEGLTNGYQALAFASTTTIQQYISSFILITFLTHGIESLRDACTQWVVAYPLIPIVKIVACATFVANAPTVLENCTRSLKRSGAESATGMAILTLLSCFDTVSGNLAKPLTRSSEMKQRVASSWLGMLEHLSPVTNFV